jgi:hypothetical protein
LTRASRFRAAARACAFAAQAVTRNMLQLRIALPFSRAKNVFTATRKCALI